MSFYRGKKVFITGHTGFKGSWLCEILLRAGADITGYALEPPSEPNLFKIYGLKEKIRSINADIRDLARLIDVFSESKPEIVIHMAAQPLVLKSYDDPVYTYETNVMGTVNILECIRKISGVRSFLNVTTDKVYMNMERREGYREDERLGGFDPYANSKSCSELATMSYKNSFLDKLGVAVSTARSGNVIGGGDFAENRLIPDCFRAASRDKNVLIRNPNAIRPYLYVLDTLFAYLLIIQEQYKNPSCADCYNIGPEESDCATNAELASLFCDAWGDGVSWENISVNSPHESNLLRLDCQKTRETFGWAPVWDIRTAARETAAWYHEYAEHRDMTALMKRQIDEFIEEAAYISG